MEIKCLILALITTMLKFTKAFSGRGLLQSVSAWGSKRHLGKLSGQKSTKVPMTMTMKMKKEGVQSVEKLSRVYNPSKLSVGSILSLIGEDANYISNVMRLKVGFVFRMFNEFSGEYLCKIIDNFRECPFNIEKVVLQIDMYLFLYYTCSYPQGTFLMKTYRISGNFGGLLIWLFSQK